MRDKDIKQRHRQFYHLKKAGWKNYIRHRDREITKLNGISNRAIVL
jgi:hypothetical protein